MWSYGRQRLHPKCLRSKPFYRNALWGLPHLRSNVPIPHARIQPHVPSQLRTGILFKLPGNPTARIIQIPEYHGIVPLGYTGLDTSGPSIGIFIDTMHAESARLHCPFSTGCMGFLIARRFMGERSCLIRASHHAIPTSDTDMPIHEHDSIGAPKRSTRGANIDTRRMLTMLTHNRQRGQPPGSDIANRNFPNPSDVGSWPVMTGKTIFLATRGNTRIASPNAPVRVYEHSPAPSIGYRLTPGTGLCKPHQSNTGNQRNGRYGTYASQEATPIDIITRHNRLISFSTIAHQSTHQWATYQDARLAHAGMEYIYFLAPIFCDVYFPVSEVTTWHWKQSIFTAAYW